MITDPTTEFGAPETAKLLCQLIESEMALDEGVVQIYNQKRRLQPFPGIIIDVAILGEHPFASSITYEVDPVTGNLMEVQTINQQELLQIDIFSYDDSARLRKLGISFALTSTAAQQLAEKYSFKIGNLPPSFIDASEVEASGRLNRYALTFNVLRSYTKTKVVEAFENLQNPPQQLLTNP